MTKQKYYISQEEQAIVFESTIGKIVSTCCSKNKEETLERNVTIRDDNEGRIYKFDYYLEKGCSNLQIASKTIIEVKFVLRRRNFVLLKNLFHKLLQNSEYNLLVLFYDCDFDTSNFDTSNFDTSNSVKVKSFNDFLSSVSKDKFDGKKVFSDTIKAVESYIDDNSNVDIDAIDIEEVEENAKKAFSLGNNTFFLGAGISKSANLPDWNELLKALLKSDNSKPFHFINDANSMAISNYLTNSAIVTGRYVIDGYNRTHNGETEFEVEQRIKSVLYNESKTTSSKLVNTIAQVIKSNKIKQVITYNYDDLIEYKLNNKTKFVSIFDISDQRNTRALPIYHVHGMISRDGEAGKAILSEKDYHELYSSMHHWTNVVQLNALYTTTCFFIGFSMSDPNQRRILDLAYKGEEKFSNDRKVPHYVFLRKEKLEGEASDEVNKEHWIQIQNMMKDLGLNVIWFENFEDLPKLIAYIVGLRKASKPNLIKVIK